jgi:hypothetical protein
MGHHVAAHLGASARAWRPAPRVSPWAGGGQGWRPRVPLGPAATYTLTPI